MKRSPELVLDSLNELQALGETITRARKRRGLTQGDIAERAGVARETVVRLEAGSAGSSLGLLVAVLSTLGFRGRLGSLLMYDEEGESLELAKGRTPRGGARDVADF